MLRYFLQGVAGYTLRKRKEEKCEKKFKRAKNLKIKYYEGEGVMEIVLRGRQFRDEQFNFVQKGREGVLWVILEIILGFSLVCHIAIVFST